MEKKVQLKEQELVGQEVVLSDIYPKTDTSSVEDIVSGSSLDLKLDRIVEMINNKLTRVVNSVNSRTGVVTLDADDVGLGNVDNVSFMDIKEWVIDTLETYFGNKRFRMFDKSSDMLSTMGTNDAKLDNVGFYVNTWDPGNNDYRSAIGIFYYSSSSNLLTYNIRYLNQIYKVDEDSLSNYVLNYDKGILKFQIDTNENALVIKTPTSLTDGGLAIDHNKLISYIYPYGTFYQTPSDMDTGVNNTQNNGFIREVTAEHPDSMKKYEVTINNSHPKYVYFCLDEEENNSQKTGDIVIISGPADLMYGTNENLTDNYKTSPFLKYHQPIIGTVFNASDATSDSSNVGTDGEIAKLFKFTTLNPFVTWGLKNQQNFAYKTDDNKIQYSNNTETQIATIGNSSGINVLSHPYQMDLREWNSDDRYDEHTPNPALNKKYSQLGTVPIYGTALGENQQETISHRQGGIFIPADASMCTYSYEDFGKTTTSESSNRSAKVKNWYASTPYQIDETTANEHKGYLNSPTFLGVNLMKGISFETDGEEEVTVSNLDEVSFIPLSGLKIMDARYRNGSSPAIECEALGLHKTDQQRFLADESKDMLVSDLTYVTGGLMVNVGRGLEIVPSSTPTSMATYNDQGKVSVRLGAGLKFDDYGCITYDPNEIQAGGSGSGLMGIQVIDNNRPGVSDALLYNLYPTTANPGGVEAYHQITLGPGLGLKIDRNDIRNLILYQMTIAKLAYFEGCTFKAKDESEFKPKDYIDPQYSYNDIVLSRLTSFLDKLEENDLIENAYRVIKSILDQENTSLSYNASYVVRSQTIHRLYTDEVRNGKITSSASGMTIDELIENYSGRHKIQTGDYKRYSDVDATPMRDYDEDVVWEDYSNQVEYPHLALLFEDLSEAQKTLINAIINMTFAIRQAVADRWDTISSPSFAEQWGDMYSSNQTPTYINPILWTKTSGGERKENKFTNYRLDTSGIIALFLSAISPDKYLLNEMNFTTEGLLKSTTPQKIKNATDSADSTDFSYVKNTNTDVNLTYDDWEFGDIGIGENFMWIWLDASETSLGIYKVYGIEFQTGKNLAQWCDSVERVVDDRTAEYSSRGEIIEKLFKTEISSTSVARKTTGSDTEKYDSETMMMRIRYTGGND